MYQVPRKYKPHLYGNYKIKWISCHQLENVKATAMFNEVLHEARFTDEVTDEFFQDENSSSILSDHKRPTYAFKFWSTLESVLSCNCLHSTHVKMEHLVIACWQSWTWLSCRAWTWLGWPAWTLLLAGLLMHVGTDCSSLDERTDLNNVVGTVMINQQPSTAKNFSPVVTVIEISAFKFSAGRFRHPITPSPV